jgi:hypothetical protein
LTGQNFFSLRRMSQQLAQAVSERSGLKHQRYPIMPTETLSQLKSGLTSAPALAAGSADEPGFDVRQPEVIWLLVRSMAWCWSWRRGCCNSQPCRNHVLPLSVAALSRFLAIHAAAVVSFCAGRPAERLAKGVILFGKLLRADVATTQCGRNEC